MASGRRIAAFAFAGALAGFCLLALLPPADTPGAAADEDAFVVEAFGHYQAGRPAQALAVLDAGLARWPANAEARYYRGLLLQGEGRPQAALEDLRAAVDLQPLYFAALRRLDLLLAAAGAAGDSLPYWDRYLKLRPQHAEAWMRRASARLALGDREGALADLSRSCDLGGMEACNRHQQMTLFQP